MSPGQAEEAEPPAKGRGHCGRRHGCVRDRGSLPKEQFLTHRQRRFLRGRSGLRWTLLDGQQLQSPRGQARCPLARRVTSGGAVRVIVPGRTHMAHTACTSGPGLWPVVGSSRSLGE